MLYKIAEKIYYDREKERVRAILQTRSPDGGLMFAQGLTAADIAQQLVGIGGTRTPSREYVEMVEVACEELATEGDLTKSE